MTNLGLVQAPGYRLRASGSIPREIAFRTRSLKPEAGSLSSYLHPITANSFLSHDRHRRPSVDVAEGVDDPLAGFETSRCGDDVDHSLHDRHVRLFEGLRLERRRREHRRPE